LAGLSPLTEAEREILELAVAAGGRFSIAGLSDSEMLQKAATVLELKRRGLVWSWIKFSREVPGQPEVIPVEVTPEGLLAVSSS
jgi:hypothetical protein